ncbi:MAG: hypothetical protein HC819_08505 [Cyclobacteriaceae bacterium]|nr:hypothetical protein [Cyclobacteriaceae bacterium]
MKSFFSGIPHFALYRFTAIVLLGVLVVYFLLPGFVYHQVWLVLLFFFLLTLASLYIIEKFTSKQPDNFLAVYFSTMIGRLFISIIFAAVVILTDRTHVFNFSINFLILYLLFLGFEIYGIMSNLRNHFKKGSENE